MNLIAFLVLGVVVDLLGRALLPDLTKDVAGTLPAVVSGAFVGGLAVSLAMGTDLARVESVNLVGSLAGALFVLTITLITGRRVGA